MCVIIYKPAGVKMPSIQTLLAASHVNPDGCGFSAPSCSYKGLSFSSFLSKVMNVSDDEPCIMHFRLATHGSIKTANCHPFKRGGVTFAHNGILNIKPIGDRTDSETAFIKYIHPAIKRYGWGSIVADEIINSVIGYSRFALMYHDDVRLYGDFIRRTDGCYYSNLRFEFYERQFSNQIVQCS